jgi:hypothetical protein
MAEPSRSGWAGWEPRRCAYCGERVTLSGEASGHSFGPPARSWHASCAVEHERDAESEAARLGLDELEEWPA